MAGYPPYPGHYPPADPYAAYAAYGAPPPYPGAAPSDEVRTVFITGFPEDVKEREVNNMLRFLPGYEASQMNWKNGQAQGFALFATAALAHAAMDGIRNMCFDDVAVLRVEMARKNMYLKDETNIKRPRTGYNSHPSTSAYSAPPAAPAAPSSSFSVGDNPACNTLFVGNVSESVNEAELANLFGQYPGFRQVKVVKSARNTSVFVEYVDVATAAAAHRGLQNATVPSSERGPLRVQFSKNPLGRKRDINGNLINCEVPAPGTGPGH